MRRVIPGVVMGGVLLVVSSASAVSWAPPTKQANAGDSISQAFNANGLPFDHPNLSWVQGTDDRVDSLYDRYRAQNPDFEQEPESVSGAEMVAGDDNFAAQAARICAQRRLPTRVSVLLGSNDVCSREESSSEDATANLYSLTTWTNALRAGLDQLASCLPPASVVMVLSMPRVDFLYRAGRDKSLWCVWGIWPLADICRLVTGEGNGARRDRIGERVDAYNDAILAEVRAYASNQNGRNPRRVGFITDWVGRMSRGFEDTSVGTFRFTEDDINGVDCFHPNVRAQARFACLAWQRGVDAEGESEDCFAR